MLRLSARKLLHETTEHIYDIFCEDVILVFDDGEVVSSPVATVFSHLFWGFHRKLRDYNGNVPTLSVRHHLSAVSKDDLIVSSTHKALMEKILWDVYKEFFEQLPDHHLFYSDDVPADLIRREHHLRDELNKVASQTQNDIHNFTVENLLEWVTSMDAVDIVDIILHPRILEIKEEMEAEITSTDTAQLKVKEEILNLSDFDDNRMARSSRAGLTKIGQAVQIVGPRNTVTETNSYIFRYPVTAGYGEGIRDCYELLIQSRDAAKSLAMSKSDLQQSEYFSRKLQFITTYVYRVVAGDCGTTRHMSWKVKEDDLPNLEGSHYLDESGEYRVVSRKDVDLIDTTIQLRNPINCNHSKPGYVCARCFGDLFYSVPDNTNIGYACAAFLAEKSTQGILSVKHDASGSGAAPIRLDEEYARYLNVSSDGNSYLLNKSTLSRTDSITLPAKFCSCLTDIYKVDDIHILSPANIATIPSFSLYDRQPDGSEVKMIFQLQQDGRIPSLSYQFLEHIKEHGFDQDSRGDFVVPLKGWNYKKRFMNMPLKHFNMSDHSKEIASVIESTMQEMERRDQGISPEAFLTELYNVVNSKLRINIAVLGIVAYGTMIVSSKMNDYRIPKADTRRGIGVLDTIMRYRSAGTTMAYQGHADFIAATSSFTVTNRPDSMFDVMLMPQIANGKLPDGI